MKPDVILVLAIVAVAWKFLFRPKGEWCVSQNVGRWYALDVLKALACMAVVVIHYHPKGAIGDVMNAACKFAVPFFFCISGYFLADREGNATADRVTRKLVHILKILLGAGLFYAIYTVGWQYAYAGKFDVGAYAAAKMTAGKIVKFFVTNDPFVYSHLWFLMALVYCYAFSLLAVRTKESVVKMAAFAPILILFSVYVSEFARALPIFRSGLPIPESKARIYYFNLAVIRAFPFFALGMWFRFKHSLLEKVRIGSLGVAVVVALGMVISYCEFRLLQRGIQFYLGTYIVVIAMWVWAVRRPDAGLRALAYIGSELSLLVYILHIAVGKAFDLLAGQCHLWGKSWFIYSRWLLVLIGTLVIAAVIHESVKRLQMVSMAAKSARAIKRTLVGRK